MSPTPDDAKVTIGGVELEPIDLTNAPAGALAHPNPESGEPHVFTQADVDRAEAAARNELARNAGVLDLTEGAPGVLFKGDDAAARLRPTHGLTAAEVEAVHARRALQGPFERRAWRTVAEYEMRLQKARKAGR